MLNDEQLMAIRLVLSDAVNDLPAVPYEQQYEFMWGAFYGTLSSYAWRQHYDESQEPIIREQISFLLKHPFSKEKV